MCARAPLPPLPCSSSITDVRPIMADDAVEAHSSSEKNAAPASSKDPHTARGVPARCAWVRCPPQAVFAALAGAKKTRVRMREPSQGASPSDAWAPVTPGSHRGCSLQPPDGVQRTAGIGSVRLWLSWLNMGSPLLAVEPPHHRQVLLVLIPPGRRPAPCARRASFLRLPRRPLLLLGDLRQPG